MAQNQKLAELTARQAWERRLRVLLAPFLLCVLACVPALPALGQTTTVQTLDSWDARLTKNDKFYVRVRELQTTIAEGVTVREISSRDARVHALQDRWDRLRRLIEVRAAEMADVPGGETGLLVRDYKGKDAATPVYRVDTRLLAELRAHERQAAEELGRWKEDKPVNKQVIVVVSRSTPPANAKPALQAPPELPRPQLEGVVIDLVPER